MTHVFRQREPDRAASARQHELVAIENVGKAYGSRTVLNDISLTVDQGTVTCLIGPSGSGKSTLLRCINHLEKIDRGRITVAGQPIGYEDRGGRLRELPDKQVSRQRASVGMVFQQFNLFQHWTVLQNIVEGPLRVKKLKRLEAEAHAHELLKEVGLSDKWNTYPAHLSGGQQQRVAIARALAMRPRLILFDEPTSALDPELRGEVLETMRGLAAHDMTMIVVTHEMGFAREIASQIAFLENGRLEAVGSAEKIFSASDNPRLDRFLATV